MTTLHQIGELLRSGVRPTDEETEHLEALGGFVAEMYGRFMGGQPEHLTSSADLFSGKLSSRLSAATGARWEQGLGLAELLLGSELTSFWQIARDGFASGYGDFGAEMGMLELYDEDVPAVAAEAELAAPRRRRPSLFGKPGQGSARGRSAGAKAPRRAGDGGARTELDLVKTGADHQGEARWADGSVAEMSVIRALASGGLFVGDQVSGVAGGRSTPVGMPPAHVASPTTSPRAAKSIALDGMWVDGRTPALATALARAQAVFGRGAAQASERAAVTEARLGRLTSGPQYSIDHGFGQGERPVYGFFDAVETTYLNLVDEAGKPAAEITDSGTRTPRSRGFASRRPTTVMPASARSVESTRAVSVQTAPALQVARGLQVGSTLPAAGAVRTARDVRGFVDAGIPGSARTVQAQATPGRSAPLSISLDHVVPPGGGLRPFVGGIYHHASGAGGRSVDVRGGGRSPMALATRILQAPDGSAVVRVQRGGMSAPRYAVVEAERTSWPGLPMPGPTAAGVFGQQVGMVREGELGVLRQVTGTIPSGAASAMFGAAPSTMGDASPVPGAAGGSVPRDGFDGFAGVRSIGGGFALAPSEAYGVRADWRSATDGGADLPLGATFSRHEVFAGTRAAQGVADPRALRGDFLPAVARGGEARPSELAQVLDGMVWVTLPDSGATPVEGDAAASMRLAAVPRRRAAMVPAGLAFQSIAGMVATRGAPSRAVSSDGAARLAGRSSGVLGEASAMPQVAVSAGAAVRGAEPSTAPVGLPVYGLGERVAAFDTRAFARALRSGLVGAPRLGVAEAAAIGAVDAGVAIGQVDASVAVGQVSSLGTAGSVGREVGTRPQSGHIVAAALGADGVDRGLRAMRLLEAAVGRGGYGKIESERELLSLIDPVAAPSGAALAEGGVGRRARGARGAVQFRGLTVQQARREAEQAQGAGRPARSSAAPASTTTVGAAQGTPPQAARVGVLAAPTTGRAPTGDVVSDVLGPFVSAASVARSALPRPVATAREARAVASAFGAFDSSASTTAAREGVNDPVTRAIRQAMARGVVMAGADEPVLGRLVQRMNALRAEQPLSARWEMSPSIIERLAGLQGAERHAVARAFASSGWSEQELEMLRLDSPRDAVEVELASQTGRGSGRRAGALGARVAGVSAGAQSVAGPARAEQLGLASGRESVTGSARAEQLGRSLARVLTGTEALGGGVADRQTGAKAGAFAQSVSAAWLPLLGGAHDYFGGLAPNAARGSASGVSSLREAVGDLVKMAETAVSASDTPIALAARRQVLKRTATVAERASSIEAAARGGSEPSTLAAAVLGRGGVGAGSAGGLAARVAESGREVAAGAQRASLTGEPDGGALPRGVASRLAGAGSGQGFDRASAFAVDRIAALAAERVSNLLAGAAGLEVEPGIFGGPALSRDMRIGEAERTMVGLEREPAGLEARLAEALALAAGGPAGARRMMRQGTLVKGGRGADQRSDASLAGGRELAAARRLDAQTPAALRAAAGGVPGELVGTGRRSEQGRARDAEAAESARVLETVMNGASPEPRQARLGADAMHDAALREETQRGLSVKLGSVMAPEAMLGGLRSPELSEAIRAVASRQAVYGFDVVPVLTTLADSGIDLEASRSSLASVRAGGRGAGAVRGPDVTGRGEGRQPFEAAGSFAVGAAESFGGLAGRVGAAGGDSSLAARAPEQALIRMLAEVDGIVSATGGGATLGRQRKAGLLSAILRGTERAEMTALLEQAGGREFAFAWLNRVDGSRSGLDIGMESTRQEFGQAFGRRRDSVMAGESPIAGASLVDTSPRKEDKSGLRSVAASVVQTATGAARPQHGASQAIRRTDWSFVDTGSRTTTPHADLSKLASAIIGSADAAQRAPMPLVAPAAKAIAQTALRDPTTKSGVKNTTASPAPAGDKRGPVDAKMSEKAIEMLALEMAGRVARLMGLMNERRGVWS